jgi:hypothetical protein
LSVYKLINFDDKDEADVIWRLNMMKQLGISQHNMCSCSVTTVGDVLYVTTSNGVDEAHVNLPAPNAPSFVAIDKNSGKVLWTDNSPGANVLHGQWSSPAWGVLGGVPQVIFGGGDGWLYSFRGDGTSHDGKPELLWKFDCNPKESKYVLGGRADRNHIIGTPVIHEGLVYVGIGEDPEHGEGVGHFWCIDPTKRGDVSTELVFNVKDLSKPIAHKRMQACVKADGDVVRDNPNSAAVWHYASYDQNKNHAPHLRHGRHPGRIVVRGRFQRPVSLPRRQDGHPLLDARHAGRRLGFAADRRRQGVRGRRGRRYLGLSAVERKRPDRRKPDVQLRLQHARRRQQYPVHRRQGPRVRHQGRRGVARASAAPRAQEGSIPLNADPNTVGKRWDNFAR